MPRLSKIGAAALAAFGWTGLSTVSATYLQVAGGGGGGSDNAAGGGAGGLLTGTTSLSLATSYTVTVGAGGAAATSGTGVNGTQGSNSQFGILTASVGGGYGGTYVNNGGNGGSGGGGGGWYAGPTTAGGSATAGQGNAGAAGATSGSGGGGGGGGGASAAGTAASGNNGGAGGNGTASSISGSSVTYAGGGGGGTGGNSGASGGAGGTGGGGTGCSTSTNSATAGTANLGGGGGGGGYGSGTNTGRQGGSGVVIISYPSPQKFGGGIVTTSGSNTIHTFQTSGTLSPLSSLTANYLIVAGGGGAGANNGGGSGAGGFLSGSGLTIDTNSIYVVTVGAGGTGTASTSVTGGSGTNSVFGAVATTAVGGGGGGGSAAAGANGGSGGGGGNSAGSSAFGTGTSGQGNNGGVGFQNAPNYAGGGGGGAGAVGSNAGSGSGSGVGGVGLANPIAGSTAGQLVGSTYYLAGGGGAGQNTGTAGAGGYGGGGAGSVLSPGTAGTANTGGGGGGAGGSNLGGAGGSGVVIISYAGSVQSMAGGTVTISGGNVIHTFTSSGYLTPLKLVNNSLRFRSSASAYLNRTAGTSTNQSIATWSFWFKRGTLGTAQRLFEGWTGNSDTGNAEIEIESDNTLLIGGYSTNWLQTSQLFRDPSAWYHIVVAFDTTQATSSNRIKLYVNGSQVTAFSTAAYPSQNSTFGLNNNSSALQIGRRRVNIVSDSFVDGYMTEVNFIDGQALTPNSFGTFNSYGVWQPITYGGSYGTNGFYLPFTNKTSTTTLGYDFSPNGNNWTTNNISLTAGVTYDSMTDVPTLTSATAANYCVLNPLYKGTNASASNANLTYSCGTNSTIVCTIGMSSGKWYWEIQNPTAKSIIGIINSSATLNTYIGVDANGWGYYGTNGQKYNNGGSAYGATFTTTDIIGVAFDAGAGTLTFYKNNTSQGTAFTSIPADTYFSAVSDDTTGGATGEINFGQRPFTYTPPSGYVALNTYNL